jgi:hypothetical protein
MNEAKRGDFKFMADKLFITQQVTFLIIDAKLSGQSKLAPIYGNLFVD